MQEQTAILVEDHGEWILVIECDDDEPERVWNNINAAIKELMQEGWWIVQDPAPIRPDPEFIGLERFEPWGYRLRRGIQWSKICMTTAGRMPIIVAFVL